MAYIAPVFRRIRAQNQLAASAFNLLDQYASSRGNRAYCYAELAVYSLALAGTTASTQRIYPQKDGQWSCCIGLSGWFSAAFCSTGELVVTR